MSRITARRDLTTWRPMGSSICSVCSSECELGPVYRDQLQSPTKSSSDCAGIELTNFVTEAVRSTTAPRPHGRPWHIRTMLWLKQPVGKHRRHSLSEGEMSDRIGSPRKHAVHIISVLHLVGIQGFIGGHTNFTTILPKRNLIWGIPRFVNI